MPNNPIKTERLIIRRWCAGDRAALGQLLQNPETMAFSLVGVHDDAAIDAWLVQSQQSHNQTTDIAGHAQATGLGHWAIVLANQSHTNTAAPFGYVKLIEVPDLTGVHEVELGIRLLPSGWGQGFAFEACAAVIAQLWATTGKAR
ncbi:MAG: GNAT family N-acetyltransferase [Pseudomonadota bacterium]